MEFLTTINWVTFFVGVGVAFIIYNTFQIIRYTLIKKKAEEDIKKLDNKIASVNKELENAKKTLQEQLKNLQK
ncbi:hypothetical protein A3J90_05140 [candidate division WOR-1 bacterium RIFOXYC2_FULL_37_10]|uniref:Uncharacterized protein n=1 Tax=candidate division WOR-1 bacterium RIFOXYB2_FULL_37_13 TaxID=1802579 RepID=A0A1F4SMV6_UNCSA|nr:MAG: hypothetical protein A2246_02700 [candidate division WOR-1 bacterium RIFOXYA2_FULL_37_7]OGC21765.1 MAG: hypothetical protein A2310_00465 [candidate division WOR-1 bacterium RIFOXYB2_FULL_37_13]OGC36721.1 MAG: hypothetical protein A3J90_05140 [candidate division WOR-1 bacterium RIFOXYC2_FULL_37_10]